MMPFSRPRVIFKKGTLFFRFSKSFSIGITPCYKKMPVESQLPLNPNLNWLIKKKKLNEITMKFWQNFTNYIKPWITKCRGFFEMKI